MAVWWWEPPLFSLFNTVDESVWSVNLRNLGKFVAVSVLIVGQRRELKASATSFGSSNGWLLQLMHLTYCRWWETANVWLHAGWELDAEDRFIPVHNFGPRIRHASRFEVHFYSVIRKCPLFVYKYSTVYESPFQISPFCLLHWPGLSSVGSEILNNWMPFRI